MIYGEGGIFDSKEGIMKGGYGEAWPSIGRGQVTHPYTLRQCQEEDFLATTTLPIPVQEAEKLIRFVLSSKVNTFSYSR